MHVDFDRRQERLIVRIDRSKISSHAKPALGRMLLRLHMYRCTADVAAVSTENRVFMGASCPDHDSLVGLIRLLIVPRVLR